MAMQEPSRTKGFPCKYCGSVCANMPSLLEHMDSHFELDEDRKFKCEECGRGYRHAGSLANHKKTHEVGSFQCQICARNLSNALALKSHLRSHTSQKKYSCMDCGKAFRLATQLATHQRVHLSRQSQGRPTRRSATLESSEDIEDNDSHHFDEQPGSVLSDQQEMRYDSESENSPSKEEEAGGVPNPGSESDKLDSEETGDRPFKCDQCDKTYRHHGSLINHRKSHSVGTFECPICFKQLNNLAALHSHQRIHNKTRSGPGGDNSSMEVAYSDATPEQFSPQNRDAPPVHFCHLCQVLYPNDEEFQEHIQMHNSSSMSFGLHEGQSEDHNVSYDRSVTQSPNSSFYASPLKHTPSMPSAMDNHGEFDYSQEQFNNTQIYSDHSSSETPSTFNTQGEQPITDPDVLDSALNQTDSGDDVTKAEEAEDGERRFRCQICGKSYRHAGSLINHKRSHQTGIYQCSICRKSYPHLAALRSHLRIHKAQPSSFSLTNEGDWLSTEPLTLESHQQGGASGFSSPEGGDSGSMMGLAQESTGGDGCGGEHSNGASFHDGQFESTFAQDRTVHLPHDEHLMENHMCADCGETFADIAGIKSHMCPLLQQQQHGALSNGYNSSIDFQGANGMIGNPEDHMEFQGLNSDPDQRYYAEHSFHESMNGEPLNEEEADDDDDDGGGGDDDDDDEEDDDGELYQCSVCGNRYTNMRALRSHLRGHTQSHGTPPSSGPSSLSSLEEEKEEDPAGERQKGDGGGLIICSTCGESFTKKQDMMAHQLLHNKAQVVDDDDAGQLDMGSSSNGAWHKEEAESIICGKCGIFCSSFHHLETHGCSTERKVDAAEYYKEEEADAGEIGNGKESKHMKENVDNGDRQYACDQCGRAYRHAGSLLNHKKSHKTGVFRCFVCQKRFYNLLALKNHQRTHFDVKRHTCTECGKAFKIQKQLQNHLRIHKENQAKIQELNDQIQALMQMNGMGSEGGGTQPLTPNANQASTSHSRRRRQPPKPTLVAEKVCQTELQTGVKSEDNGDPRPYSCDQCGRTYRHAGSLVNHRNSHKTGEYYCSVCNNTYSNQLAMKNHLRIHFALKKHSCQECGRAFRGKKQLSSHVCRKEVKGGAPRGRGRRRAIKCKECGQAFSSADQLTAHTCDSRSNPNGGKTGGASLKKEERPFTCNVCNRSYRHAGSLLNHKNTHMTGHFSCTFCSKPFSNPMALRNHTRIHTQKKKHVCLTCGKAFRLSSILHNHQKVHTRVASHFSCPACGKSFQGKSGLKRHRCQKKTEDSACRAGGGGSGGAGGAGAGAGGGGGGGGGHHSEGGGDKCFMCDLCGRSYRHAGSLLNHKKTHSENLHHCTLCLQTFPDPMTLQIHSQMKRHCCPECGKTFCLVAHLQSHMEVHNSKDRTLVCSPCHQSFPNTATYQQHQDLHHRAHPELHHRPHQDLHHRALPELHPRPHQDLQHRPQGHYQHQDMSGAGHMQDGLGWGSEGLDQTMGLQGMPKLVPAFAHMHSGMPDPQLDPHQQDDAKARGAGGDEEKSHACEHCGRTYRHAGSLLNHKNSHKTGSFFCSVCQKEFTNLMALKNHRRIHTEPKRYQCLECGKAFRVSTQLICHRRIHTKEKPFSCLLCDKRFSSKSNLRHHQKMHQQNAQAYESSFSMEAANAFLDLDMGSFL